jgi:A/G-specific adenine glycosylase
MIERRMTDSQFLGEGVIVRIQAIRPLLLTWFEHSARDLPWRRTRDPYRIMVSEIMLQQTQVDRVIPKYLAFLEQFPTVEALAAAPTAEVIRAWAGLGYNRRAVNMQRAARAVLETHGGRFPREVDALLSLPGIGPYTAGAIACFAFEADVGFMDTNIRRVVRRLFFRGDEAPAERELLAIAAAAVPAGQGWAWNQAIMELGALVCTAAVPQCWRCPLRQHCADYAWRREQDEQAVLEFGGAAPIAPLRLAERRQPSYASSNRYYRGRIIDALRAQPSGLPIDQLGPQLKGDYGEGQRDWLAALVDGLVRDGLAVRDGEWLRLPE